MRAAYTLGAIFLTILAEPRAAAACLLFQAAEPPAPATAPASEQAAPASTQAAPASEQPAPASEKPALEKPAPALEKNAASAPTLDFDLLGDAKAQPKVDESAIRRRRTLLSLHQAAGIGLFAIALGNTVVGQLNYSDRFANGPSTGRYELAHQITAYGTVGMFAVTGLLALVAPSPLPKDGGWDRVSWHKLSMIAATAGFAAETVLGIYTASREGYQNQNSFAAAHLVIGYATFAALSVGVGVLVF